MFIEAVLFDVFNTLVMVEYSDAFYMPALRKLHKNLTENDVIIPFEQFKSVYFQVREKLYADAAAKMEEPPFNTRISQTLQSFDINLPPEHPTVVKATSTFCKEFIKHTRLDPDARTVLPQLSRKYKLGIVSNFAMPECEHTLLKQLRIAEYFRTVIISGAVNKRKPSPAVFQKALQALNVQPINAIFVGDTPDVDIQGAKNAGLKAILIERTPLLEDTIEPTYQTPGQTPTVQPDHTIRRLTELQRILEEH
jgi:putative hydrolase of the HAD superfamily